MQEKRKTREGTFFGTTKQERKLDSHVPHAVCDAKSCPFMPKALQVQNYMVCMVFCKILCGASLRQHFGTRSDAVRCYKTESML